MDTLLVSGERAPSSGKSSGLTVAQEKKKKKAEVKEEMFNLAQQVELRHLNLL